MNLRCPYCKLISELDSFTTGEQRRYIYSTTQNLARRAAEELIEDAFDGISGTSSGPVKFSADAGDVDFGRVAVESPTFTTNVKYTICTECSVSYGVEVESEGVCPVCR